jgi:uncharacterized tellurite resistance protein B-like protein
MKPRDFIQLIDDPTASRAIERSERTELLLTMLVHLFFADRRLDDGEVSLLKRLLPADADVQGYIEELAARKLDIARLGELFPDPRDRDDIITLAEHAVWGDNEVDAREWDLVDKLVEQLGVERA